MNSLADDELAAVEQHDIARRQLALAARLYDAVHLNEPRLDRLFRVATALCGLFALEEVIEPKRAGRFFSV